MHIGIQIPCTVRPPTGEYTFVKKEIAPVNFPPGSGSQKVREAPPGVWNPFGVNEGVIEWQPRQDCGYELRPPPRARSRNLGVVAIL